MSIISCGKNLDFTVNKRVDNSQKELDMLAFAIIFPKIANKKLGMLLPQL